MPHTLTANMPRARIPHTHEHAKPTSPHVHLSGGSSLQRSEPHSLGRHKIVLGSARSKSVSSSLKRNTIRLRLGRAALELAGPTLCRRSTVWNHEPPVQVASPLSGARGLEIVGWCALHTVQCHCFIRQPVSFVPPCPFTDHLPFKQPALAVHTQQGGKRRTQLLR